MLEFNYSQSDRTFNFRTFLIHHRIVRTIIYWENHGGLLGVRIISILYSILVAIANC